MRLKHATRYRGSQSLWEMSIWQVLSYLRPSLLGLMYQGIQVLVIRGHVGVHDGLKELIRQFTRVVSNSHRRWVWRTIGVLGCHVCTTEVCVGP